MVIHRVSAFIGSPGDKRFIGNPALVVSHNLPEHRVAATFRPLAARLKYPILTTVDTLRNIRFFESQGTEINMCGHGSLAISFLLNGDQLIFRRNPEFNAANGPSEFSLIQCSEGRIGIRFQAAEVTGEPEFATILVRLLGLKSQPIKALIGTTYGDVVMVLPNSFALRNMAPEFTTLAQFLQKANRRMVIGLAPSRESGFDWELRAFGPHWGLNDDIACGSANASAYPVMELLGLVESGKTYRNLYPYTLWDQGLFGGCQWVSYDSQDVLVEGYVSPPQEIFEPTPFCLEEYLK